MVETLEKLYPRRNVKSGRLTGPRGFIELKQDLQGNNVKLWVVVDIHNTRPLHSVEKILNDPNYTLCNDGEYSFDLNFSDKYRALQLIGFKPDRRG